ncbi:MAG TPA: hypothetical protein DC052_10175, partial [Pseudomonas sp.]|nr:hypothetical protein [Pseudomonas sp.]
PSAWPRPPSACTARSTSASNPSPCDSAPMPAMPMCRAATSRPCWKPWAWSVPGCIRRTSTSNWPASRRGST